MITRLQNILREKELFVALSKILISSTAGGLGRPICFHIFFNLAFFSSWPLLFLHQGCFGWDFTSFIFCTDLTDLFSVIIISVLQKTYFTVMIIATFHKYIQCALCLKRYTIWCVNFCCLFYCTLSVKKARPVKAGSLALYLQYHSTCKYAATG